MRELLLLQANAMEKLTRRRGNRRSPPGLSWGNINYMQKKLLLLLPSTKLRILSEGERGIDQRSETVYTVSAAAVAEVKSVVVYIHKLCTV